MRRTWNILITAAQNGGYTVTCSPTAFGGGSLMGRAFDSEGELRDFLQAIGVRDEEIARGLSAVSGADAARRTCTLRNVEFSDEEITRQRLRPV